MRFFLIPLTVALAAAAPASAQDSADSFQDRVFATASAPPGSGSRIPTLCGGFYTALAAISADSPEDQAAFLDGHDVSRTIGLAVHMLDMVDTDLTRDEAEAFIDTRIAAIAAIYADWFRFNLATEQTPITDAIGENYRFCNGYYTDWTTSPSDN